MTHTSRKPKIRSRRRTVCAAAINCIALIAWAAECARAQGPMVPIMFTSTYSQSKREPLTGGATVNDSYTDQNISFNTRLPGFHTQGQSLSMNFNQTNTKRSGGGATTATNMGFSLGMSGRFFSYNTNYSLVENQSDSGGGNKRNENLSMGVSVNRPRFPGVSVLFNRFEAAGRFSESSQMNSNWHIGRTSLNYNDIGTNSTNPNSPDSRTRSATLGVSRQLLSQKRLSITTSLNTQRQTSFTGGTQMIRNTTQVVSASIYDSHIRALPLNLNVNFQKSNQALPQTLQTSSQSSRNFNAFTGFMLPGAINTGVTWNLSSIRDNSQNSRSDSQTINVTARKDLNRKTTVSYNVTTQQTKRSDGAATPSSRSAFIAVATSLIPDMTAVIQTGNTYQGVVGVGGTPRSRFVSVGVQSALPGGVTSNYQYLVSRAGAAQKTESLNLSVPLNAAMQMSMNATRRQASGRRDRTFGVSTSMALSPAMSFSTTFSRQKTDGRTQSKIWSMSLASLLPHRITMNVALSVSEDGNSRNTSTTTSMTTMF